MILYDHFKEAKKIIEDLKNTGQTEWAARIDDAISVCSGTEILMGLRFNLKKMLDESNNLSTAIVSKAQEIIRHCDLSLND